MHITTKNLGIFFINFTNVKQSTIFKRCVFCIRENCFVAVFIFLLTPIDLSLRTLLRDGSRWKSFGSKLDFYWMSKAFSTMGGHNTSTIHYRSWRLWWITITFIFHAHSCRSKLSLLLCSRFQKKSVLHFCRT